MSEPATPFDYESASLLCTYIRGCLETAERITCELELSDADLAVMDRLHAVLCAAKMYNAALLDQMPGGAGDTLPHLVASIPRCHP